MTFTKFEHENPNDLWQMDFKGLYPLEDKSRCHPLTILDDHSRFSITVKACANERENTVKEELIRVFRTYGLPKRINTDNGSPWGTGGVGDGYTSLSAFLIRLGIRVSQSRPYHPQTNGKIERFHRTLKTELLRYYRFEDLQNMQDGFDWWRDEYNLGRPHQALGYKCPVDRYSRSEREYPEVLPEIEYGPETEVRKVQKEGWIDYRGEKYRISRAFIGYPVGLRPTQEDGKMDVYFCHQKVKTLDLTGA